MHRPNELYNGKCVDHSLLHKLKVSFLIHAGDNALTHDSDAASAITFRKQFPEPSIEVDQVRRTACSVGLIRWNDQALAVVAHDLEVRP